MRLKTLRKRKCKCGCGQWFIPGRSFQTWATIDCAVTIANNTRRKAEHKKDNQRRLALRTRRDYIKEAQAAFNAFIRYRDKGKPCICCGEPLTLNAVGGGYDCGHYRSVGSAPHLRFDECNAHAQRKQCNRWRSGNAVDYRLGLIKRIGLEAVEDLEANNDPRKYSIDELKAIKASYAAKLKELRNAAK